MMTRLHYDIDTICNTVGQKDCPYNTVKMIDQYENELPVGKEGEFVSKGPTVFTGYFKSDEENKNIFTKDGFFKTGDLAKIDEQGHHQGDGQDKRDHPARWRDDQRRRHRATHLHSSGGRRGRRDRYA